MPDTTLHFRNFTNGLYLASEETIMPEGTTRRNRGISSLYEGMFVSRDGSRQIHAVNAAHSLTYFDDVWFAGVGTNFYSATEIIKQTLSGDRLSFTHMGPTAGKEDYLFVAAGDELFKASNLIYADGTQLITNGDMELDANWANYGTPSTNERSTAQIYVGDYSRKFTADAANEGIQGDVFTTVALGLYRVTFWVYPDDDTLVRVHVRNGANDAWAYSDVITTLTEDAWNEITFVYQEASGKGGAGAYIVFESDTATSGDWYVDEVSIQLGYYATNWGIVPPVGTIILTEGAAGNLVDEYKYALTYKNSITGSRSNPLYGYDLNVRLLLHCEGVDASTTFTESSSYAHTTSAEDDAQIDTAQKKFGSASALFDGASDYVKVTNAPTLSPGDEPFCIDAWVRFDDVSTYDTNMIFTWYTAGETAIRCWSRISSGTKHYLYFDYYNDSGYVVSIASIGAVRFTVDTWHHVAFIRGWGGDISTFAITLDGVLLGTDSYSGDILLGASDIWIGWDSTASISSTFAGWMDEVQYQIGTAGFTEAFTPPTVAYTQGLIDVASKAVALSNIPVSSDPQVDTVEIWRTIGDGSAYFLTDSIPNGTTTYTDDIADTALTSTELPLDNDKPYPWFDDCFGPYNASMFWLTRTQAGERGRVYYSPIGRAEAMEGFIEVSQDDKGLQRGIIWQDTPFIFGEAGVYQLAGTNPYFSRIVAGVPGTTNPHTIEATPAGIIYEAEDGVRIFNGTSSVLASTENVQTIFRGRTGVALTAFNGVIAAYGKGDYFISDESQLIAFNIRKKTWRDVGDLSVKSLYYAKDADIIGAGTNADGIYDLENETATQDNSNDIAIDLETQHLRLGDDAGGLVKNIHIDHESNNAGTETLTVYLEHDGSETSLGTVARYSRAVETLNVNKICKEFGIRITGSISEQIKIYRISADVYTRAEETR